MDKLIAHILLCIMLAVDISVIAVTIYYVIKFSPKRYKKSKQDKE